LLSSTVKPFRDAAYDTTLAECQGECWASSYWSNRKKIPYIYISIIRVPVKRGWHY